MVTKNMEETYPEGTIPFPNIVDFQGVK